jgi:hypothetical protein
MAFEIINTNQYPGLAASVIQDRQVVTMTTSERGVCPVAAATVEPHGITIASALLGEAVTVMGQGNYAKAVAAASLGFGTLVGVTGATRSLGLAAGASGSVVWAVGRSCTAAAAGEVFTFYVNPRQLSGTP